jgi:two-component system, chemotaxis family, CheB/CheR fusion protein
MAVRRKKSNIVAKRRAAKNVARGPRRIENREEAADQLADGGRSVFPIVAVGASAGGLEAFTDLLRNIRKPPEAALIYIAHLDPNQTSALPQILSRETSMPVLEVEDGVRVERNKVYVMPPSVEMTISDGVLHLQKIPEKRPHLPIDTFFQSLAMDQGSRAIGVILSGTASDGTIGTKAIKAEGGITFAQDDSARFNGMPRSASNAGGVDFVLAPRDIVKEVTTIARHAYVADPGSNERTLPEAELSKIYALVRSAHDTDFTNYKSATVERRIKRRMALRKVEDISAYVDLLNDDPLELDQLYADILIRVTGFFRDPEVFEALAADVIPRLIQERAGKDPVRIWVPGCATGEEVYSLAITMLEVAARLGVNECPMQLFGTDVSEGAIERARAGLYPETISREVSPDRLRRYFTGVEGMYRVAKSVRDCCIFAKQNVTRDPPFSRLDLISCRNVMIYLGAGLQRKVLSIFQYALRPNGYLLLGSSETIGKFTDAFTIIDRKHKIYRRKLAASHLPLDLEAAAPADPVSRFRDDIEVGVPSNLFREADRVALTRYAPAGVLVNETGDVIQFRGRTSAFLEPAPGAANFNILKMAREGLLAELRTAMFTARKNEQPVRREGIRIRNNGKSIMANIEVLPFVTASKDFYQLVIFEEARFVPTGKKDKKTRVSETREVTTLKRELEATRDYLQSIIEEQETMNEELRSANEEIQSSNEELQSTNEELETAKEELQASNEELTTLNEELETRNRDLGQANDDLLNLFSSIDIPVVMFDSALRIRRFNPGAQRLLGIAPTDVGRSIDELKTTLEVNDLQARITDVIDTLTAHEDSVKDRNGRMFQLRIRPYRTGENKIEGAVLVLVNLDQVKRAPA